ncbi:hypothetical protein GUJ93_ZPchr0012g20554 [Zizania palustris]|uniref:Uncharacterized protein n=1 Tax=Zizania palustris TaxID=103762 RepID=A0A8J5WWC3_ZIZPA|nr:hypothetical protein GUJ93_ZPchr0012g20554 [Zizania palustris]
MPTLLHNRCLGSSPCISGTYLLHALFNCCCCISNNLRTNGAAAHADKAAVVFFSCVLTLLLRFRPLAPKAVHSHAT